MTDFETWNEVLQKNLPSVITLSSSIVSLGLAYVSWQIRMTHKSVNSQFSTLLQLQKEASLALGNLTGRKELIEEQRQEVEAAKAAVASCSETGE